MKEISAIIKGINTTKDVILKFSTNREVKKTLFVCIGPKSSYKYYLLLLRMLNPLTNLKAERAAKHGFNWFRVIRERKLICKTAIIYTTIILPYIKPTKKNISARTPTTVANTEIILAVLYVY
jgi:hypothetical protein